MSRATIQEPMHGDCWADVPFVSNETWDWCCSRRWILWCRSPIWCIKVDRKWGISFLGWHVHALISAKGQSLQPPHALISFFEIFENMNILSFCLEMGKYLAHSIPRERQAHGRGCFSENWSIASALPIFSHWIYISNKSQFYYSCFAVWRECEYDTIQ